MRKERTVASPGRKLYAAALLAGVLGCGVGFVDQRPPLLSRQTRTVSAGAIPQPLVFDIILDLNLPDPTTCGDAVAHLENDIRSAFLARDSGAFELPEQNLSPNCTQSAARSLDVDPLFQALESLPAPAGTTLRPVFAYFNNIDLPLPDSLIDAFADIHKRTLDSEPPPIWAVASDSVLVSFAFDERFVWTYSADPELAAVLMNTARSDLPFVSRSILESQPIPLFPQGAGDVVSFKICGSTDVDAGFARDGVAVTIDPEQPPVFYLATPDVFAVAPGQYAGETVSLALELCTANCDRYAAGATLHGLWAETPGCFLPGSS